MVVAEKADMLSLIARYATQVGDARQDAAKMCELFKIVDRAHRAYRELSNALEYAFHQLTELMLEHGIEIPADDERLTALQQKFAHADQLREGLIEALKQPFGDLGDVIEFSW